MKSSLQWILILALWSLASGVLSSEEDDEEDYHSDNSSPPDIIASTNNGQHDIFTCCSEVFGSCRTSCENLSLVQLAASDLNGRGYRVGELKKYCSSIQVEFWNCMNRTLQAVQRGSQWSGRRCCSLGMSPRCRNACATSSSTEELIYACRQSDEQHMFSCFERQEAGDRCCGNSRTSECLQACREIFEPHSPQKKANRRLLNQTCGEKNLDVLKCVKNFTDMTPITDSQIYLPCCEFSNEEKCRTTCRQVLKNGESTDVIIDELVAGGCGPPLPHNPLWQCFLSAGKKVYIPTSTSSEVSQINQIGIDSAKLHCCHKAIAPKCRRLCVQTFSNDWTSTRGSFDVDCLMQPNELELRQCIDEVDEPCELGCDGLSFCTNFNNRPTELFRSCHSHADMAARSDVAMWTLRGFVSLPGNNLPIKNISKCSPEKWRAIACTLQIKPCTRVKHYNHVCREDCYEILSECMDWSRVNTAINVDAICSQLHPEGEEGPCVSLKPYLEPSDAPLEMGGHHGLTEPCKGHPCNSTEACLPNRNESTGYQCIPGCALGEASAYIVPFGAYVRIPVSPNQRGSFKVCRCGSSGRIEHCQPLPSFSYDSCSLGGRGIEHGVSVYLECNICSCFAGEITCTKKQCRMPGISDQSFTSLPCNCPTHYVPVCGKNGNTYHSACVAKCLGLQDSDIEFGACTSYNPCQEGAYSCPMGSKCVEDRKICLSVMHRPCLQYRCVNLTSDCLNSGKPVCDTRGVTYPSACHLLSAKSQLAHFGSCFRSCSWKGPVCGINGVTYRNECEAWADYILVDYKGPCKEVGILASDMGRRCKLFKCPEPPSPYCRNIIPPGACCPICTGAFRVIYSRKQVDRALYALKGKNMELLTLRSILKALDELIQISECQLTGFLTMEVDIFVGIVPRATHPTEIQIDACSREAQKIATLIQSQSHRITTNLALSALTVANLVQPTVESSAIVWNCLSKYVLVVWIVFSFRQKTF